MSRITDIISGRNQPPQSSSLKEPERTDSPPVKENDIRQWVGDGGEIDKQLTLFPPIEGKTAYEDVQAAFGYLHHDEMEGLLETVKELPENPVIVNIGAGSGTSVSVFMSRPDAQVVSVDKEPGISPLGGLGNEEILLRRYGLHDLSRYVTIGMDSHKAIEVYKKHDGRLIDLLFIDGDHSQEGCQKDYDLWSVFVKEGGLVVFHDLHSKNWKEVTKVVDGLQKNHSITLVEKYNTMGVFTINVKDIANEQHPDNSSGRQTRKMGASVSETAPKNTKSTPRRRKSTRKTT